MRHSPQSQCAKLLEAWSSVGESCTAVGAILRDLNTYHQFAAAANKQLAWVVATRSTMLLEEAAADVQMAELLCAKHRGHQADVDAGGRALELIVGTGVELQQQGHPQTVCSTYVC